MTDAGPLPGCDGCDAVDFLEKLAPGVLARKEEDIIRTPRAISRVISRVGWYETRLIMVAHAHGVKVLGFL